MSSSFFFFFGLVMSLTREPPELLVIDAELPNVACVANKRSVILFAASDLPCPCLVAIVYGYVVVRVRLSTPIEGYASSVFLAARRRLRKRLCCLQLSWFW
eukprot:m.22613 g.22613  ORF g.22613 m.22613 type:complete len:101 (-) comp8402_c0_seq1:644-946(-)